jgi:MGT family glycosyltransferase
LPPHAVYVGPILEDPDWAEQPWTPPPGDQPLVLVALSSTFQDHVGSLQRAVDALSTLPVRGLVTTGPTVDPAELVLPPNVTAVAAAPHSSVLSHASAVVTHGGHGTVVKSLAAGVPLVLLPHGRDQADNAVRVELRGAGLRLRRTATPRSIATAIARLLDDASFATNADRLGTALRHDAADDRSVAELEGLATAVAPAALLPSRVGDDGPIRRTEAR